MFSKSYLLLLLAASTVIVAAPLQKRQAGPNLQPFTGALGGIAAPAINNDGRALPFRCDGESFADLKSAIQKSCDTQCAQCRDGNVVKPEDCGAQRKACLAGDNNAPAGAAGGANGDSPKDAGNNATPVGAAGGANGDAPKDAGNNAAPKTAAATDNGAAGAGGNLQKFTGVLGAPCPTVTNDGSARPFKVEGNANFDNLQNACIRSCDVQFNKCQNAFNAQPNNAQVIKQGDCAAQQDKCLIEARKTGAGAEGAKTAAAVDSAEIAKVANNGEKEGADIQSNAQAAQQDQKDDAANAAAVSAAPPPPVAEAEKGGKGGIDPATGETLLPLPDVTAFCAASGQVPSDGTQIKTGMCSSLYDFS